MALQLPTLHLLLHADFLFVAQGRRGLLRQAHEAAAEAGMFRTVADLQAAIDCFLDEHKGGSEPLNWIAGPERIIVAFRRGHQVLDRNLNFEHRCDR
jgi:hypothetical protein